jgi:hypothetical protein
MKVLKFILPLCLLLPSPVIITQKAEAQAQVHCTPYEEGNLECRRAPGQMYAACLTTAKFSTCQTYFKGWCQMGSQLLSAAGHREACVFFNLSRSNPKYFQQIMTANKFCTSGNQKACNWIKQQGSL